MSLSSSTIRPTRHHSLADKSFFGKFEALTSEFDELPEYDGVCDVCDEPTLPEDSTLNLPEPTNDLAKRAELTRSSLLEKKSSSVNAGSASTLADASTTKPAAYYGSANRKSPAHAQCL